MRYLLLIAFALGSFKSFASHIVGGEMVYDYLGNDSFKVRMQYYVDCVNGIPGAIADDKYAYISILNSDTFVTQAVVRRSMPIRLNETNYTCVTSYGNVCVDMYLYDTFFVLPPIKGGYDVVFQRCCRNGTILNIQGPDSTGATYTAHIPEMNSTITHNSNPRFNKLPPNYLCLNEVLYFDHSATDPDGDSLFYRLHTPFDGGTSLSPRPKTPTKYSEVIWRKGYSDSVPIIVKDSIFLNEHNGRLVLTPRILGQFVFGIAVEEYRNDSLISTTYRDYQFNVVRCNNTIGADFYAPNPWCSKRVLLESFVSNGTNYKWYVDSVILTNQWSYLHQFPDTGRYNVKLVVFDGNCKDSVTKTVRIVSDSFSLGIDSFESCKQGMVEFETKFINDAVYDWQINGDWQLVDRNHVVHQPANAGWHWVKLEFLDCYMFDSFYVTDISPALGIDIPPLICSDSLRLDLSKGKFDNYNLDAPNATVYRDNYLAPIIVFKDTGTYYFSIDYNIKNCISFLFEQIRYLEEGSLKNFETELCKNDSLTIIATYFENATYNWLNRPTYLKRDSLEEYSGKATGSANFSVEISTNNVCVFTNNFNVEVYNPKSVFEWKLDTTCTGLNLFLSNHSKGDSVAWKMNGELLELPENGLLNNLNFSKQYTVDLLAFEKFCSDTFSQTFSAQNPASFNYSYPNVITPNNDGLNDCFLVETEQSRYCHNYRFWVYNRWGEILYKSETENEIPCWDGTNMLNDQLVSQGTYFFILEIENQRYNGTITVLY